MIAYPGALFVVWLALDYGLDDVTMNGRCTEPRYVGTRSPEELNDCPQRQINWVDVWLPEGL